MLQQLLELKRRQEQQLRQDISAGEQRAQYLQTRQAELLDKQSELHQEWRMFSQQQRGKYKKLEFFELQRQLDQFYKMDGFIKQEMQHITEQLTHWQNERIQLLEKVRQILVKKEKLLYVQQEGL